MAKSGCFSKLLLVALVMVARSIITADAAVERQLLLSGNLEGNDTECLAGLVEAVIKPKGADRNKSWALRTWTSAAVQSPCNFTHKLHGITCNDTRVVSISLPSADLVGVLEDTIASCYYLQKLDLSANTFSGQIPTTVSDLSFLSELSLYSNNFSGGIPIELASLYQLTKLDLHDNHFSGLIPPQIGLNQKLKFFNVSDNDLSGIVPFTLSNTSTGAPRFGMDSFANNLNLYGYPIPPPPANDQSHHSHYSRASIAAIAAICIGGGLGLGTLLVYTGCMLRARRRNKRAFEAEQLRLQREAELTRPRTWKEMVDIINSV